MRFLAASIFLVFPCIAHGAVIISEIAWMGSAVSPNDEWIELYNTGDAPVSLDGWTLTDHADFSIELMGTIDQKEYVVLERTDDATVEGKAFLIYTGSLSNDGATLSLRTADQTLEDQVAGGDAWENIGGDNTTKETAQKTDAGWRTAVATPGSGPDAFVVHTEEEEEEGAEHDAKEDEKIIELQLPNNSLDLSLRAPDIAYVNQPVVFDVEPSGLGKTFLDSLEYTWNFGDFTTHAGKKVTHVFTHPGEYVVTLHGTYTRHEAVERTTITILPVTFSLSRNAEGDVLLKNNAKYEVNVSGYTLKGRERLQFPLRSIILPNSTITIERKRLGGSFASVFLYDQEGELVATLDQNEPMPAVAQDTQTSVRKEESVARNTEDVTQELMSSNFSFTEEVTRVKDEVVRKTPSSTALALASVEQAASFPKESLPLLGLFGIVTLGIIAVLLGKKKAE